MMKLVINCILVGILMQTLLISAKIPDWVPSDMIDMVAGDKDRCMAEHGTTQALIDQVNEGNIPNDRAISCYMFCLFETFSMIDEDGVLEADMLTSLFPDDIQARGGPILSGCAVQEGADVCDKIYKIATCIQSQAPEMWFMI